MEFNYSRIRYFFILLRNILFLVSILFYLRSFGDISKAYTWFGLGLALYFFYRFIKTLLVPRNQIYLAKNIFEKGGYRYSSKEYFFKVREVNLGVFGIYLDEYFYIKIYRWSDKKLERKFDCSLYRRKDRLYLKRFVEANTRSS